MATIPASLKKPNKLEVAGKITSKGQITLPVEIRRQLGVKEGDSVKFVVDGEGLTSVFPVREEGVNPFDKWIGAAPAFSSIEEINAWVSDLRDDEERKADLDEWREIKRQRALKVS